MDSITVSVKNVFIFVTVKMIANLRYLRFHRLSRGYKSDSKHYAQQPQFVTKSQEAKGVEVNFSKAKHGTFFQQPYQLRNPWSTDAFANKLAQNYLPKEVRIDVNSETFGNFNPFIKDFQTGCG